MSTYREVKNIADLLVGGAGVNVSDTVAQASLASIDDKTPVLGQAAMVDSTPVAIASDQSAVPITSTTLALESGGNLDSISLALSGGPLALDNNIRFGDVAGTSVQEIKAHNLAVPEVFNVLADGNYAPTLLMAASTIQLSSESADDTLAGVGAQIVLVTGLDANFDEITESVNMNGQVASVATTALFLRLNELRVTQVGSGGNNKANLYASPSGQALTAGRPDAAILRSMRTLHNQSHCGLYTVPNNFEFFMTHQMIGVDCDVDKPVEVLIRQRTAGQPFYAHSHSHYTAHNAVDMRSFKQFAPKTDIVILAKCPRTVSLQFYLNGYLKSV